MIWSLARSWINWNVNGNHDIMTQKWKRKNYLPRQHLTHGPHEPKASKLPMSYTDPITFINITYFVGPLSGEFNNITFILQGRCVKSLWWVVLLSFMNGKLSPSNFFILNLTSTFVKKHILFENSFQSSTNHGPYSTFVDDANSKRLKLKP